MKNGLEEVKVGVDRQTYTSQSSLALLTVSI